MLAGRKKFMASLEIPTSIEPLEQEAWPVQTELPEYRIAVLPGDGIGPEVTAQAVRVLQAIGEKFGHRFLVTSFPIGGAALRLTGAPLPPETLQGCLESDAILLGAVGAPEFDENPPPLKPETALLQLRRHLDAFANLRPALLHEPLIDASPLKRDIVEATDLLIVRELTGGVYFAHPRGFEEIAPGVHAAFNTMRYRSDEIQRIAHIAFQAARRRRQKVTSVDKANVLETSQLWRKVVSQVATEYPDISLEHVYVDTCAMQLIAHPRRFDVILTENLFGDILSDEAAMLTGSIGMLPSASLGGRVGLYEPVHGSAPDIAGKGIANPLATIASVALMLRYSFDLEQEARAIEQAIDLALRLGYRTADIYRGEGHLVNTEQMGDQIISLLRSDD
jgi:3-isopropylmalate dehydrogenase